MRLCAPSVVTSAVVASIAFAPGIVAAQSISSEASATAGYSTEEKVSAAATQVRVFGDLSPYMRFYVEGAWGNTKDRDVPAFGAAYPYGNRIQAVEAYGESTVRPGSALLSLKAGRYRTPFGISSGSDQAYLGFLRAPLIRYDNYYALSNNFLEQGVDLVVGIPRLTLEASAGTPADIGSAERRSGFDPVVRVQTYVGNLIAGASYIRTLPYQNPLFALGHAQFTGLDARWSYDGVQLRGEYLWGRPFNGTTTDGWYADAIVHRVGMGPVTAVARIESLDYDTPFVKFILKGTRQTVGARIRVLQQLALQVNLVHQTGQIASYGQNNDERPSHWPLDIGLTYSIRRP